MNNPVEQNRWYNSNKDIVSSIRNEISHNIFAMKNKSLMIIIRTAGQIEFTEYMVEQSCNSSSEKQYTRSTFAVCKYSIQYLAHLFL